MEIKNYKITENVRLIVDLEKDNLKAIRIKYKSKGYEIIKESIIGMNVYLTYQKVTEKVK